MSNKVNPNLSKGFFLFGKAKNPNSSTINGKSTIMNKTLEGLKNLETGFEKKNNKIFITKRTRSSSTGVFSDLSTHRGQKLKDTVSNDKFVDSVVVEEIPYMNHYQTIEQNQKIKDLKRDFFRQKSALVNSFSSRNLKKQLLANAVPYEKRIIKRENKTVSNEKFLLKHRPKSSTSALKLTFTRNQSIPMLIHPPKKQSNKSTLSSILHKSGMRSKRLHEKVDNHKDGDSPNTSFELQRRKRQGTSPSRNSFVDLSLDETNSEDRDIFQLNKEGPRKDQQVVKNFLKSKANKLNLVWENDNFFSTTTNYVNYFEEVYKVPHFKNKLCFKSKESEKNDLIANHPELNVEEDYKKYLQKLEILKVHNNFDLVSTFFLNTWKRKFQEKKDNDAKKLSLEEQQIKALEEQKTKMKNKLMINEHMFLEYLQYKYDKHNKKIQFADVYERTRIIMKDHEPRRNRARRLKSSGLIPPPVKNLEEILTDHIKRDHVKHYKQHKNSCDDLKKIVEKLKNKVAF